MDNLRPCPFCGSGWLYETRRNGYCDETPTMFCNSCKAVVTWEQVEEEGVNDETKTFVREHWNTRAERTCKLDYDRHCSNCGVYVHKSAVLVRKDLDDGWTVVSKPVSYCPNCGAKVVSE